MQESEKWKWSRSVLSNSPRPYGLQLTRFLYPWNFPGKSTGVGCHCLFQNNPREYQIVRTHKKETTWIQDPASPNHQYHLVQDASSKEEKKQKYKPNHQQVGLPLTQPCPSEKKWRNNKNAAQISPYRKLTKPTGPILGGQKPKGRKNLTLKPGKRRRQTQ